MNNFNWDKFVATLPNDLHDLLEEMRNIKEDSFSNPEPDGYMNVRIMTERLAQARGTSMMLVGFFAQLGKAVLRKQGKEAPYSGYQIESFKLACANRDLILKFRGNAYLIQEVLKHHHRFAQMKMSERSERINKQNQDLMALYPNYSFPKKPVMSFAKQREIKEMKIYPLLEMTYAASNMTEEFVLEE